MVSEWFPSGFRVVSEWFPSGFGVFRGFVPVFWALKAVRRLVRGFVRGFVPGFWALKAVRRVVRGFVRGFVPGFCALKAVQRVVREFVRGVVPPILRPQSCPEGCPGVCPGGCPGFWTQNVKTGVYAEPPLSKSKSRPGPPSPSPFQLSALSTEHDRKEFGRPKRESPAVRIELACVQQAQASPVVFHRGREERRLQQLLLKLALHERCLAGLRSARSVREDSARSLALSARLLIYCPELGPQMVHAPRLEKNRHSPCGFPTGRIATTKRGLQHPKGLR